MVSITDDDFEAVLADCGRSVTHRAVAETVNADYGSPTALTNTDVKITVAIFIKTETNKQEMSGELNYGDAVGYFDVDSGVSNDDLIVDGSDTYRITKLTNKKIGSTTIYQKALLIKK